MEPRRKSCGTCRDRRISCNRGLPACVQCIRSNRECQGYGIRLSWPKANDRKRAMVGNGPIIRLKLHAPSSARMINASSWDIEIHNHLTSSKFNPNFTPIIPKPLSWSSIKCGTDYNLVQYFESIASKSLTTVSEGSPDLRDVLIRISLSNHGPLSTAVLQSLLAFSSVHRHGLQPHAARLTRSAISQLAVSAKTGLSDDQVILHVATLMLLCCFEIQQGSESPTQWLYYISSVKSVLKAAHLRPVESTSDMAALLYWVSYHDVLSKFSLHHWRHSVLQNTSQNLTIEVPDISFGELVEASRYQFPCWGMLKLVSDVFNMVLSTTPPTKPPTLHHHQNLLTILEWKIMQDPHLTSLKEESPCQNLPTHNLTLEAFRLSLFIYVDRLINPSSSTSPKLLAIIKRGINILSKLDMLDRQFPLLILGSEARSDEDRIIVLDLIARTDEIGGVRSLKGLKDLIQSLWAQDDLAEKEVPYMKKIQAVFSSSAILPALV